MLAVALLVLWSAPARAQRWSIVMGAIGYDQAATDRSAALVALVREQLEQYDIITVRDVSHGLRVELPVTALYSRAVNIEADGVAVVQFHATESPTAGYAHLWVSRLGAAPEERLEYVADADADLTAIARAFAAAIVSTISRGAFHVAEFHVFTWPPDVSFTVGDADPVVTNRPGRQPGEGFNMWSGLRPAGTTEIVFRKPGYQQRTVRIDLPAPGGEPSRVPIEVSLTPLPD